MIVSINLLTFNGEKYIKNCLDSVLVQTYPEIDLLVIDNNSQDGTQNEIKKFFQKNKLKNLKTYNLKTNVGFSAGHNIGIRESRGEFILCLNQDVILDKDFVKNIVEIFQKDHKIGAVQGKLYRLIESRNTHRTVHGTDTEQNVIPSEAKDLDSSAPESLQNDGKDIRVYPRVDPLAPYRNEVSGSGRLSASTIIDTTGLVMLKNRRIINRGQGEIDVGQYDANINNLELQVTSYKLQEIFGADGAAPVYRRKALEDIKLPSNFRVYPRCYPRLSASIDEYFDESFFCYKEDVDLAWRLRLAGWKTIYKPKSVAWHIRGSGDSAERNLPGIVRERRMISSKAKFYSFKNQRLMQIKNELPSLFLKHLPSILLKEIGAWLYILFFESYTLKAVKSLIEEIPSALRKRKMIMNKKRVGAREMEKWFV